MGILDYRWVVEVIDDQCLFYNQETISTIFVSSLNEGLPTLGKES